MLMELYDNWGLAETLFKDYYVKYEENATKQLEGFLKFFKENGSTTIQNTGFETFSCDSDFNNWKKRTLNETNKITESAC